MKIYNSFTNKKEEFKPIEDGKVGIYVCGPTVYNYVHIGNTRPMIIFDVLRRTLEYLGYDVTFVSNYTDVDDKIIKKAKEEGVSEKELTEKYKYFAEKNDMFLSGGTDSHEKQIFSREPKISQNLLEEKFLK